MVFFTCDTCGESLKKNQVQRHTFKCFSNQYSCIDCQKVFNKNDYVEHIKCISENQKYGGANYVEKVAKGEVKQTKWIELVNEAVNFVTDEEVKKILISIRGHPNIPKKEAKFINFLKNSNPRHYAFAQRVWAEITKATERLKENEKAEEEKKISSVDSKVDEEEKETISTKDSTEKEANTESSSLHPNDNSSLLASNKLTKKIHKLVKAATATERKELIRHGLADVQKALRKSEKGIVILAESEDQNPIPMLCSEHKIPYIFVSSSERLGLASGQTRSVVATFIKKSGNYSELYKQIKKEILEFHTKVEV